MSQAMIASGNWVLPRTYSNAVPSKPPFTHWLSAIVSTVTGQVNEFTVRFPSALAFILITLAWHYFVSRRLGNATALQSSMSGAAIRSTDEHMTGGHGVPQTQAGQKLRLASSFV